MAALHKEYFKIDTHEIKFSVLYVKGVGYRVSSHPVKRSSGGLFSIEEFEAFSGFNDTLLICNRQGAARLREAIAILNTRRQTYFEWYKNKYGWEGEITNTTNTTNNINNLVNLVI